MPSRLEARMLPLCFVFPRIFNMMHFEAGYTSTQSLASDYSNYCNILIYPDTR